MKVALRSLAPALLSTLRHETRQSAIVIAMEKEQELGSSLKVSAIVETFISHASVSLKCFSVANEKVCSELFVVYQLSQPAERK
jgi:hypothetical protein